MKTEKRIVVIAATLVLLLIGGSLPAEQLRFAQNLYGDRVLLPVSVPDHDRLGMVGLITVELEEELIVTLAFYDDPLTKNSADYLELYDLEGGLLMISWIDRFGVVRTAIDQALLEEDASGLEGVFVIVADGTPA